MERIVIHHTGGSYRPNQSDKKCYHYLIDNEGSIIKGNFKPSDNLNCLDGKYAPHIKLHNTGSIGVACCANANYSITNRSHSTKYPLTQIQVEAMCSLIAHLCITYSLDVNEHTVFTHYEYDQLHKNDKNIYEGKSDITFLPFCPNIPICSVGVYLRAKVQWYKYKYERSFRYETQKNV